MSLIAGMRVIFTPNAMEATEERLFPASKNRSARIRKKLIKRFGGEFRMQPCMWKAGDMLYAHPTFKPQIEAAIPSHTRGFGVDYGSPAAGW